MLFSGGRRCMYTQNWFTLLLQHAVSWSGYCQCGVSKLYTKLRALFCRLICLSRTHCQNNTQQTWWSINFLPSWGIQSLPCHNFKFRSNPRQKFWSRWCLSFLPQSHIFFLGLFYVVFFFFNYFYFSGVVQGLHCCIQAFSSCREWVLPSSCDAWVSHCSGFCCGAPALGHAGFSSCI